MAGSDYEFDDDDLVDDLLLEALANAEKNAATAPPPRPEAPPPRFQPAGAAGTKLAIPSPAPQQYTARNVSANGTNRFSNAAPGRSGMVGGGGRQTTLDSFTSRAIPNATGTRPAGPHTNVKSGQHSGGTGTGRAKGTTKGTTLSYARAQYCPGSNAGAGAGDCGTASSNTGRGEVAIDPEAAKTWIYPTNYAVRDYQFNIVQRCLFVNTLVALPTGLGKTLIAAVVMYNFFRWFPGGKIVFMAPTKPLVAQQIEACFKVTGIPQDATDELTGTTSPELRRLSWMSKRVFFLTPQVMQNDLNRGTCPAKKMVLLVVDEAHRATGNHAYCEVVRELRRHNEQFRILALTATPGSEVKTVQNVVENLLISRIEIRTEDSLDIKPYIHQRNLELVTVPLGDTINAIKDAYCKILGIYIGRLCRAKVYYNPDPHTASRFALLQARERWRAENNVSLTPGRASTIEGDFGVAMTLSGALQLLMQHSIRSFYAALSTYVDEANQEGQRISRARAELLNNRDFIGLMEQLRGIMADRAFISHPKIERLVGLVVKHFSDHEEEARELERSGRGGEVRETRVMIFSQYRESVDEIVTVLSEQKPMVRVMSFVGQSAGKKKGGKGFTQKEQLQVISKFQSGGYNTLVATSIGEEGLDIGEIDLIICYDAQNSPIRMLQRMGRTGRKREGKVVLLLTEGREEDAHRKSQAQYRSVQKAIMDQQGKRIKMYPEELAKMFPAGVHPACVKKNLEIPIYDIGKTAKGKAAAAKGARRSSAGVGSNGFVAENDSSGPYLSELENAEYERKFLLQDPPPPVNLGKYMYWQTRQLPQKKLNRSRRSKAFVECVKLMEKIALDEEEGKKSTFGEDMRMWLCMEDVEMDPSESRITVKKDGRKARRKHGGTEGTPKPQLDECSESDDEAFDTRQAVRRKGKRGVGRLDDGMESESDLDRMVGGKASIHRKGNGDGDGDDDGEGDGDSDGEVPQPAVIANTEEDNGILVYDPGFEDTEIAIDQEDEVPPLPPPLLITEDGASGGDLNEAESRDVQRSVEKTVSHERRLHPRVSPPRLASSLSPSFPSFGGVLADEEAFADAIEDAGNGPETWVPETPLKKFSRGRETKLAEQLTAANGTCVDVEERDGEPREIQRRFTAMLASAAREGSDGTGRASAKTVSPGVCPAVDNVGRRQLSSVGEKTPVLERTRTLRPTYSTSSRRQNSAVTNSSEADRFFSELEATPLLKQRRRPVSWPKDPFCPAKRVRPRRSIPAQGDQEPVNARHFGPMLGTVTNGLNVNAATGKPHDLHKSVTTKNPTVALKPPSPSLQLELKAAGQQGLQTSELNCERKDLPPPSQGDTSHTTESKSIAVTRPTNVVEPTGVAADAQTVEVMSHAPDAADTVLDDFDGIIFDDDDMEEVMRMMDAKPSGGAHVGLEHADTIIGSEVDGDRTGDAPDSKRSTQVEQMDGGEAISDALRSERPEKGSPVRSDTPQEQPASSPPLSQTPIRFVKRNRRLIVEDDSPCAAPVCATNMPVGSSPSSLPDSQPIRLPGKRKLVISTPTKKRASPIIEFATPTPRVHKRLRQGLAKSPSPNGSEDEDEDGAGVKDVPTPLAERLARKKAPRPPPRERGSPILAKRKDRGPQRRPAVRKRARFVDANPFIEREAELSGEDGSEVSSDESSGDDDCDLSGFVVGDDETPIRATQSISAAASPCAGKSPGDLMAFYRKSLLSPELGGMGSRALGGFRLKYGLGQGIGRQKARWIDEDEDDEDDDDEDLRDFIVDDGDEGEEGNNRRKKAIVDDDDTEAVEAEVSDDDFDGHDFGQFSRAQGQKRKRGVDGSKRTHQEKEAIDCQTFESPFEPGGTKSVFAAQLAPPQPGRVPQSNHVNSKSGSDMTSAHGKQLDGGVSLPKTKNGCITAGAIPAAGVQKNVKGKEPALPPPQTSNRGIKPQAEPRAGLPIASNKTVPPSKPPLNPPTSPGMAPASLTIDEADLEGLSDIVWDDNFDLDLADDAAIMGETNPGGPDPSAAALRTPDHSLRPKSSIFHTSDLQPGPKKSRFDFAGPSPIRDFSKLTTPQRATLFEPSRAVAHAESVYQVVDSRVTVLVDNREMRSTICSLLRNKFRVRTEIRQLAIGDYIVSNRIALERKTKTDLLNSVYNKRVFDQIAALKAMCDIPIILVEKEKDDGADSMAKANQFEGILATLTRMKVRVLFSDSSEQSAQIIHDLAKMEAKEEARIDVPDLLPEKQNQMFRFLLSIPGISDVTAMTIMNARFRSLKEFLNCDLDTLLQRVPGLSRARGRTIMEYIGKDFEPELAEGDGDPG
ncbi:hypothetical protein HK104_008100 [Borealophlyctis nickersoniae]|nr:hypothetical protein HK104_008100 [Borealophlyctis nickersoniae]